MGNSKFNCNDEKGTFNLTVAFDEEVLANLKEIEIDLESVKKYLKETYFEIVSLILQRATYGQHELGPVDIVSKDSNDVDILITKYNTNVYGRIWNAGQVEFSINHIYSPGLMLHELGHYLYHLGDEYKGCRKKRWNPETPEIKGDPASIMEYSFGNNTRYKRKNEDREYKVLEGGGFDEFWKDIKGNNTELVYKAGEVVTDFCHDSIEGLKHNTISDSEQNIVNKKRSCWTVMLDGSVGIKRQGTYDYSKLGCLKDPEGIEFDRGEIESNLESFSNLDIKSLIKSKKKETSF